MSTPIDPHAEARDRKRDKARKGVQLRGNRRVFIKADMIVKRGRDAAQRLREMRGEDE